MIPNGYTEDALDDITLNSLDVLVTSRLFVRLRDWNDSSEDKKAEAALLGRLRYSFYTW